jgi:hypothetical protein
MPSDVICAEMKIESFELLTRNRSLFVHI